MIELRKYISTVSCIVAAIYTVWYMHFGTAYKNEGALSTIGLERRGYFVIWGVLTIAALCINITLAYKRYTKTKAYIPLLVISATGMIMTLCFDFDFDEKVQYYLHCAGSLIFSAVTGITVFVLFLLNFKKGKIFKAFTVITAVILLGDFVLLLIYQETGLIETVPIFAGYIMLAVINTRSDKVEIFG